MRKQYSYEDEKRKEWTFLCDEDKEWLIKLAILKDKEELSEEDKQWHFSLSHYFSTIETTTNCIPQALLIKRLAEAS